jgi:hypothetical protein
VVWAVLDRPFEVWMAKHSLELGPSSRPALSTTRRSTALRAFIESNRALPLGRYLRNLAGASAIGLLGACTSPWPEDVPDFVAASCTGDPQPTNWLVEKVDTAGEALFVARSAGFEVNCDNETRWAVREVAGGFEVVATKQMGPPGGCGGLFELRRFLLFIDADANVTVLDEQLLERLNDDQCAIGRRPPGLLSHTDGYDSLGRFFAGIAHLEAASVPAFEILEAELRALGAPCGLVTEARRSRDDEVRHAARMDALARRFGSTPAEVRVEQKPMRSLFEVALDNAVEGCVRETYGALVATHQAMTATDDEVRSAMLDIADDETRHAALSWQIAAWASPQLTDSEHAAIETAQKEAIAALRIESRIGPVDEVATIAGMPRAAAAAAMVDTLANELWA